MSHETGGTRLHAKAWPFRRQSGFSTAYIGSSNLTHSAQISGLEWNVRISAARNRGVVDKMAAVFDGYWHSTDFRPYERDEFLTRSAEGAGARTTLTVAPTELRPEPFQERLLEQIALARQQGHDGRCEIERALRFWPGFGSARGLHGECTAKPARNTAAGGSATRAEGLRS